MGFKRCIKKHIYGRIKKETKRRGRRGTKIINVEQIFKSDECVICLNNPSNVLFCNCGHICICEECEKTRSLKNCPICKIENQIKRIIN